MKTIGFFLIITFSVLQTLAQNHSATYDEVIRHYQRLQREHKECRLIPYGKTDAGYPLHLFVVSAGQQFNPDEIHMSGKLVFFVNNGIHGGEPDGIDASMRFADSLLTNPAYSDLTDSIVFCIVPVLNVDGMLNRSCCSRVNQNGPQEYGFRANAKNLDLNRDMVKADAQNTRSLIHILRQWDPDICIDTHVSDGADYQHTMTLIPTQHNKLNPVLGKYLHEKLQPELFGMMASKGDTMCPYVDTRDPRGVPDSGIVAFIETPRYLSGYLAAMNTISFISEAHMLKPFRQRMLSTLRLLHSLSQVCRSDMAAIKAARNRAFEHDRQIKEYSFNYVIDTNTFELISFRGYEAKLRKSNVTGHQRLYFDHAAPFEKKIKYFSTCNPTKTVYIPDYYFIPQGWTEVISRLDAAGISMIRMNIDSVVTAGLQYIDSFSTVKLPYEGRYLHYNVSTRTDTQEVSIQKGDYLVPVRQRGMRYILETLEATAKDSYFNWGFFDAILQQKEYYSPFVFEDYAAKFLAENLELNIEFHRMKREDPAFNADPEAQLDFVYRQTPYFEKSFRRYPVIRLFSSKPD